MSAPKAHLTAQMPDDSWGSRPQLSDITVRLHDHSDNCGVQLWT